MVARLRENQKRRVAEVTYAAKARIVNLGSVPDWTLLRSSSFPRISSARSHRPCCNAAGNWSVVAAHHILHPLQMICRASPTSNTTRESSKKKPTCAASRMRPSVHATSP